MRVGIAWRMVSCLAAFTLGCAGDGRPPALKAGGKVSFQGKQVNGALVVFHPQGKDRENGPKPVATTGDDGAFQLTTYEEKDGAPAGEYLATIVWNQVSSKTPKFSIGEGGSGGVDKLGGKFGNPKGSTLKFTVTKQGPNDFAIDLK